MCIANYCFFVIVVFSKSAQLLLFHQNIIYSILSTTTASTWLVSRDRVGWILWRTLLLRSQPSTAHKLYTMHSYSLLSSGHFRGRQMILMLAADQTDGQLLNNSFLGHQSILLKNMFVHYTLYKCWHRLFVSSITDQPKKQPLHIKHNHWLS